MYRLLNRIVYDKAYYQGYDKGVSDAISVIRHMAQEEVEKITKMQGKETI